MDKQIEDRTKKAEAQLFVPEIIGAVVEQRPIDGSPTISKLIADLVAASAEIENPVKDRTAVVKTKTGGQYSYSYADLSTVLNAVRPALSAHSLAVIAVPDVAPDFVRVTTMLVHASGEWLSISIGVKMASDDRLSGVQAVGSALTYLRRYGIQALLNITAETDDDGNMAVGNEAETSKNPNVKAPAPAAMPSNAQTAGGAVITDPQVKFLHVELGKAKKTTADVYKHLAEHGVKNPTTGEPIDNVVQIPKAAFNAVLAFVRS